MFSPYQYVRVTAEHVFPVSSFASLFVKKHHVNIDVSDAKCIKNRLNIQKGIFFTNAIHLLMCIINNTCVNVSV